MAGETQQTMGYNLETEIRVVKRLLALGSRYVHRRTLMPLLVEEWGGNEADAGMHLNSMMRRGLIDYEDDGDWEVLVTEADLQEWLDELGPDFQS